MSLSQTGWFSQCRPSTMVAWVKSISHHCCNPSEKDISDQETCLK